MDLYHCHKTQSDFIDCVVMADYLKCGYTADYFYNLPLERFEIFTKFIEIKRKEEDETIKQYLKK